ncbi:carboxypeptidase-like regulatory domain-containing protein [Salibacteraceae bacterium]|nr:carboxypeptidase-like regulatory domain-containing protein [Salibacteraceae bacterium]MDB9708809.1 carboxypeptidase-like regulatory domain-containing protein [Salibacteraceae bacterium]MDC1304954.1 carboxypeptidase-like regulatory domain-containing protein [Salibacteraceae bacterium]
MLSRLSLILLFILIAIGQSFAQKVTIKGQVVHKEDPTFNLLIVNRNTSKGTFGEKDGSFKVMADKNDTLLVGAIGYKTYKLSLKDSTLKSDYSVRIYLQPISFDLKEVEVFPGRELESIQKDIRSLGYDERDYVLTGIDAYMSPLTFLYQQLSRKEQLKRRAYEIINEDRKRELLKELFIKYVNYDIIDLSRDEFDEFIDFINVSDRQLMSMSQYDFVIFTKERFEAFRRKPQRLLQDINTHD